MNKPLIQFDPCNKFTHLTNEEIREICGLPLRWVLTTSFTTPLIPHLDSLYQHGGGWRDIDVYSEEGTIGPDLSLFYPGDPTLYPLVRVNRPNETFCQYNYGIVSVTTDGKTRVARMD